MMSLASANAQHSSAATAWMMFGDQNSSNNCSNSTNMESPLTHSIPNIPGLNGVQLAQMLLAQLQAQHDKTSLKV